MQISSSCCKEEENNPKLSYFIFPKRSRAKGSMCLPLGRRGERTKRRKEQKECLKVQGTFFLKLCRNHILDPKSPLRSSSIFVRISGQDIPQQDKLPHFLSKPGKPFQFPPSSKFQARQVLHLANLPGFWVFFFSLISP